jgi:plastocyanin
MPPAATHSRTRILFLLSPFSFLLLAPLLLALQPAPAKVTIQDLAYSPAQITISKGQSVTWTNQDSRDHTVKSADGSPASFTSPNLSPGQSFTQSFPTPGTYPYGCAYHPRMKGTITVKP